MRALLFVPVIALLAWSCFVLATRDGAAAAPDSAASDTAAAQYLGNHKCRICHSKQFKTWQTTVHAAALTNLVKADSAAIKAMARKLGVKLKGPAHQLDDCLKCHVVGLRQPGGYPSPDSTAHANLAAVGCESCHGPGSRHMTAAEGQHKATIQRGASQAMCRTCHTAQTSPKFDFATYRKTGIHVLPPP